MNCEHAQPLLLQQLFGLLDDAEQQELTTHLDTCPACQAALEQARQQQLVLSLAAKGDFSNVRFEPPTVPLRHPDSEATQALVKPVAPRRRWGRWAVAAAVLLAVGAGVALGAVPWIQHTQEIAATQERLRQSRLAQQYLQDAQSRDQGQADAELRAIQEEINKLRERWDKQPSKDVEVTVTGPEDIQAGTTNSYTIETYRLQKAVPGLQGQ